MNELIKRERVKGLLSVEGRKLVNGEGEEIILSGVGFGNWLHPGICGLSGDLMTDHIA